MAEELENELSQPSETEKRIKSLSGKVKEEAEAKEKALQEKAGAEKKAAEIQTERDFYAGILAKVRSGYTVEDATFAVLGKAEKLGVQSQKTEDSESAAGGSAATAVNSGSSTKKIKDMSREELRQALVEAEARGDLSIT